MRNLKPFSRPPFLLPALLMLAALLLPPAAAEALEFPALTGRVVDNANLLPPNQERGLTRQLERHEAETSNQVVVVTLPSLQGTTIEDYGYQLGRHWAVGQADRNNGVLLIVAPASRKVRIEVGYGLEGDLPDAITKAIIEREILPAFRDGDFPRGIAAGVNGILAAIAGSYAPQPRSASPQERFGPLILFLLALAVILFAYLEKVGGSSGTGTGYRRSGWGGSSTGGFGGGGGGGGGFSGGGGSFGGGGSSGSW
ncbi:TPM domain-containing protein [Denitrobaculum tricleocarpae]|uniref:TPM domain-containing protein n=1 Tax=Denitrobaculum tricleocarpae TaxID=2591009 RepID=A0A545T7W1_9PROT|nr:TPM domain-containing protein [Denitrobaculum tricleocarpae]TQV73278.1 TPM domain-containing protein [Denitrobaculum tricleocarpae]